MTYLRYDFPAEASAEEARHCVQALTGVLKDPAATPSLEEFHQAKEADKKITGQINEALVHTFVTQLEREDIEVLSACLYKIPRTVEKFAERYRISVGRIGGADFSRQIKLMDQAVHLVLQMTQALRAGRNPGGIKTLQNELQSLEAEADDVLLDMMKKFYEPGFLPLQAVILKDLCDLNEKVVDRCRDAGNVISHAQERLIHGTGPRFRCHLLRAGVHVHQRLSRHRQCHRDRGRHQSAHAAAGHSSRGGDESLWGLFWPGRGQDDLQRHRRGGVHHATRDGVRDGRRHLLEPAHLVLRHPQQFQPRHRRQHRRRGPRGRIFAVTGTLGMPVSTTHAITTSIMGVGCAKRFSALKLMVVERILWAWILTLPATAGVTFGLIWLGYKVGFIPIVPQ